MPEPWGQILNDADDIEPIRDMLGLEVYELPDDMIGGSPFLLAAEKHVMSRVPNWWTILNLAAPAAPTLAAVASAGSALLATTYYVVLVARVGTTFSLPSAEASQAILANQGLQVTAPQAPGITSYDVYVGTATLAEFLQTNLAPGAVVVLTSYSMAGTPIAQVAGPGETLTSDAANLKAAVQAATCAEVCKRLTRRVPGDTRTLTFSEHLNVNWAEEMERYMVDCSYYLGLISTYLPTLTPPPAMAVAHPPFMPTDPAYVEGSDPDAVPPPFGTSQYPY